MILKKCDKDINVEKSASFSTRCSIGNHSGIGINPKLSAFHIGDNALVGPKCVILLRNHSFINIDKLIKNQGYI